MNPYLVLGLTPSAGETAIRQAYLEAIRVATPERDPARFRQLTAAYELIRDETSRHRHALFCQDTGADSPVDAVRRTLRLLPPGRPLPREKMQEFLRDCAQP
jgi:curved DNA-binding protein CbpA